MLIKIKDLYEQLFSRATGRDDVYTKPQLQARDGGSDPKELRGSEVGNEQGCIKEESK